MTQIEGESRTDTDWAKRIGSLYELGVDITGTRQSAVEWMYTPNRGLAGVAPIIYAISDEGILEVENLLERLSHGIVV